jgi:para-nitrobenzyl esterase
MKLFLLFCAALASTACGNDKSSQSGLSAPGPDVVMVPNVGTISGMNSGTIRSFKGIPYAVPPVGPLRWKPPQKAPPLTATLDATKFASGCVQDMNPFGTGSTNEDCLYLNVYAPIGHQVLKDGPYPVMVWIHGGAFLNGESTEYDPTKLVEQGVVVVTINYRLGMMGFLAHPAIDNGPGVASTNYGLLDQQLALHWVQDNIGSFGGDKTNVTIFGESAGGFSVHSQLVMPNAHGLFAKAIIESGAYGNTLQPTIDTAKMQGQTFAMNAHCPDPCTADYLRSLKASDVLAAQDALKIQNLLPAVDGTVIPMAVGGALMSGAYEKVPVMEGSNHDEWALFVGLYLNTANTKLANEMDYEAAAAAVFQQPAAIAMSLIAPYPLANYMNNPNLALTAAGTDFVFSCPSRASALQISASSPTFVYEFSDPKAPELFLPVPSMDPSFQYGAAHASELQYLWNLPTPAGKELSADQQALSSTMVEYWTQFAKTGNPNGGSLPMWPAFSAANESVLTLNTPASAVVATTGFSAEHKCVAAMPSGAM